jgi:hypothetical protein
MADSLCKAIMKAQTQVLSVVLLQCAKPYNHNSLLNREETTVFYSVSLCWWQNRFLFIHSLR